MKERPDYVCCVLREGTKETYCGNPKYPGFFQSSEHARLNEINDGRLSICPECRNKIKFYWLRRCYRNLGATDSKPFPNRDKACYAAIDAVKTEDVAFVYLMTTDAFGEVFEHIFRPSEYLS